MWDLRAALRALSATLIALAVVWLVTAASDEGQLTAGVRAGRTMPVAPLCSAIGAALALATSRVREETLALEALGRSSAQNAISASVGAALPSIAVALLLALNGRLDVGAFYPRPPHADVFAMRSERFVSQTLGVSVGPDGDLAAAPGVEVPDPVDPDLPKDARCAAAWATAVAGAGLAFVGSGVAMNPSFEPEAARRRRRLRLVASGVACALATLIAFQAAAAKVTPAGAAVLAPLSLLAWQLGQLRRRPRWRAKS